MPIVIPVTFVSPCHSIASVAPPKPAPIASVIPYADMIDRLVPLMVSVVKIGDELSAAALTRGLGAPVKRTNVCQIGFHIQDMIAVLLCALCFALFLMGQYFVF